MYEGFINCTVLISHELEPGEFTFGTGFTVYRHEEQDIGKCFLITNKHLLPDEGSEKKITLKVNIRVGAKLSVTEIDVPIVGEDGEFLPAVKFHPNKDYDIAAVNIIEQIKSFNIAGTLILYSLFATKERLIKENINAGDEILILGYPDAIYDPRNVSPVMRQGIIATNPIEGYAFNEELKRKHGLPDYIDGFLIDANVFPGSSGSVVILKPQPTTIGSQRETKISFEKKNPYLLGIVSGSLPIDDVALQSTQRMGLGIAYSSDAIKKTIEQFYSQNS